MIAVEGNNNILCSYSQLYLLARQKSLLYLIFTMNSTVDESIFYWWLSNLMPLICIGNKHEYIATNFIKTITFKLPCMQNPALFVWQRLTKWQVLSKCNEYHLRHSQSLFYLQFPGSVSSRSG